MQSDLFPESFDPTRCILFLGAGFSVGAKNRLGKSPPVGTELAKEIKKFCRLPENESDDFSLLADYAVKNKFDLYRLLEDLYTISSVSDNQRKVLSQPWGRIYTTNFDNIVTLFGLNGGDIGLEKIFDLTDFPPKRFRAKSVVHLHGSIAKCDPDKIDECLVLTRRSYVQQRVKRSVWWDWFSKDLRTAQYIFFLGYDLNDFEPAAYLHQVSGETYKRHFILRDTQSLLATTKLQDFGVRHGFELEGFANRLDRAIVGPTPSDSRALSAFSVLDLEKDGKLPVSPTSADVAELLAYGKLSARAISATLPQSSYILHRKELLDKCRSLFRDCRTVVVHGRVANGKSVVCEDFKVSFSAEGRTCFTLKENVTPPPQEIEFLKLARKPIIFFHSYDNAVENMHLFEEVGEGANFVVEMSTSTLDVRFAEVNQRLSGKVGRLNVERMTKDDIASFKTLLRGAGLSRLASSAGLKPGVEMRDFILTVYDDPEIARRIDVATKPLFESVDARKILSVICLLKASGNNVDPNFIEEALELDPYVVLYRHEQCVRDIIDFDLNKIELNSAVLADVLLKRNFTSNEMVDSIYLLAYEASRRIEDCDDYEGQRFRTSRTLLSSIIRFGFLESRLRGRQEARKVIGKLYERCRHNELIKKEPLFWLQYSTFWQEDGRLDHAEAHMKEAYVRGSERANFKTYQLDTHNLKLVCELERAAPSGTQIQRWESLQHVVAACTGMINDGNHRAHVLKAFMSVEPMLSERAGDFTPAQGLALSLSLKLAIDRLSSFSADEKAYLGSERCRLSLERGLGHLARVARRPQT